MPPRLPSTTLEVVVLWEGAEPVVLHVAHLDAGKSFALGEGADFAIGAEMLGGARRDVVRVEGDLAFVVVPAGATGGLARSGEFRAWSESEESVALAKGDCASVTLGGITCRVSLDDAAPRIAVGPPALRARDHAWTLVSLGVHLAVLVSWLLLPPHGTSLSLDALEDARRLIRYQILPDDETPPPDSTWITASGEDSSGGTGERHRDEEGAMGAPTERTARGRYAVRGDAPQAALARATGEVAATTGALGVLHRMAAGWNAPSSPFGAEALTGVDAASALGALMGDVSGANAGFGGLGLNGTGRGGGGTGEGTIGLGRIGTIGHGAGRGTSDGTGSGGSGYGSAAGGFGGRTSSHGCGPRCTTTAVTTGGLSREVVRRVVRRHVQEARFCYEQELQQRPDLAGRVSLTFMIARDGSVSSATVTESTIASEPVESCLASAVRRWGFPASDGPTAVNYPFSFDTP